MMLGKREIYIQLILIFSICIHCDSGPTPANGQTSSAPELEQLTTKLQVGAERLKLYLPMLANKKVGMLVNQSSMIQKTHLADSLLALGVDLVKVFAPEHGFRGKADAGEKVKDGFDGKTGLPIISLYGKNKKPSAEQLSGLDLLLFDLQDVGVRFYTYTSSLHYLMEACAEQGLPVIILDRPNPNIRYVAGNIHSLEKKSFVGMHPVPIMHGMTIGEYGQMINGQGWLKDGIKCELTVIPCSNYNRETTYELPIPPSPNLPNLRSVLLYPSLCLFEGTVVSVGRGTKTPFQLFGHPDLPAQGFSFTPMPSHGAKHPKLEGKICNGTNLGDLPLFENGIGGLDLSFLIATYAAFPDKENFFLKNGFFETLCGDGDLRKMIEAGKTVGEIEESWEQGIEAFKDLRKKYLVYE